MTPKRAKAQPAGEHSGTPAKITPPRLPGVYNRTRLFRELDRARRHSVVWIAAPAGYGKTTLVASYLKTRALPTLWYQLDQGDADIASYFHYLGLAARRTAPRARWSLPPFTPEYFESLPLFARRMFEQLAARLPAQTVIVLDNYQDVPADAPLHGVLHDSFSQIPVGMTVIVVSRFDPPSAYVTDRANNTLVTIGHAELRLTEQESIGIYRTRAGAKNPESRDAVLQFHQRADGWPAGLVLLMAQGNVDARLSSPASEAPLEVVFDYFYRELFEKTDAETQQLLLRTAYLPIVSPAAAEELTQNPRAGEILSRLRRNNFFTFLRSSGTALYQYHPLLRDFLAAQTQCFTAPEREEVLRRSADLLQREGQVDDAAQLLHVAGDFSALGALIKQHAPAFLERGSHRTVATWLEKLPLEARDSDPWLVFWLGACRLPFDVAEARELFTRAYDDFLARSDAAGAFLAWASAVEAIAFEWDDWSQLGRWISELDELLRLFPTFPSPQIEARVANGALLVLMFGQPSHPEIGVWWQRLKGIVEQTRDPNQRVSLGIHLVIYALVWVGELDNADGVLPLIRPPRGTKLSPICEISWQICFSCWCWMNDRPEEGLAAVAAAQRVSEEHGITLWNFLINAAGVDLNLARGDLTQAAPFLAELERLLTPRRRVDLGHYQFYRGCIAGLRGEYGKGVTSVEQAVELLGGAACAYLPNAHADLELTRLRHRAGLSEAALEHADRALKLALSMRSPLLQYEALRLRAWVCLESKRETQGLEDLRAAFALGREKSYARLTYYINDPSIFATLCARALDAEIEVEYAAALIRTRALTPPSSEAVPEAWPLPIKIYTLGRFALLRDGKLVQFTSKLQKRPFELLKALIAFGGRAVREDTLAEALWPEAEADAAAHSLTSTLHRLRALVGPDAIQRQSGKLSLDARYCWVDAWSFERELTTIETAQRTERPDESAASTERLVNRYRGEFLEGDLETPWLLRARARLRVRFLRLLESLGAAHLGAHRFAQAQMCFAKAVEIDALAESSYRGLMRVSLAQGRYADTLSTYDRCCKALSGGLGCTPSLETTALLEKVDRSFA